MHAVVTAGGKQYRVAQGDKITVEKIEGNNGCLLYTSDAADERSSVDLGGRRIIKKKKSRKRHSSSDANMWITTRRHSKSREEEEAVSAERI